MNASDSQPYTTPDNQADAQWMTFKELAAIRGISKLSAVALVRRHGWRRQRDNQGHVRALVPLTWAAREADDQTHNQPDNSADTEAYNRAFETALRAVEAAHASEVAALREQIAAVAQARDTAQALANQFAGAVRDSDEAARLDRVRLNAEIADLRGDLDTARAKAQEALQWAEAAERAGTALTTERSRADALQAGQELMMDMHARALAAVQGDLDMARAQATTAHDALKAVRQAQADRKGRGLLARVRAALRGE